MAYARRTFGGNMQIGDLVKYNGVDADGGSIAFITGLRPNGYDCYIMINGQIWLVTLADLELIA